MSGEKYPAKLVERIAAAMCGAYGDDYSEQPKDLDALIAIRATEGRQVHPYDPGLPTQQDWQECAEAALSAIRYAAMRGALEDAEALIRDGGIVPVKGVTWSKVRSALRAADGEET